MSRSGTIARIVSPLVVSAVVIVCLAVILSPPRNAIGITEAEQTIRAMVLAPDDGFPFGPGTIQAKDVDPVTGALRDFHITCPDVLISAHTATVLIDADADTLTFDLYGVIFTRVPHDADDEAGRLREAEHYRLGPYPFGQDVVGK